ncbi:hypothetical protein Tco_1024052 [Tanacetum coccineum]
MLVGVQLHVHEFAPEYSTMLKPYLRIVRLILVVGVGAGAGAGVGAGVGVGVSGVGVSGVGAGVGVACVPSSRKTS